MAIKSGQSWLRQAMPGIALAIGLALTAKLVAEAIGQAMVDAQKSPISPILCAVLLGVLWRNLIGVSGRFEVGLGWVMQSLLKGGIALVGLRLTLAGATAIATVAVPVVVGCFIVAFLASLLIARYLKVNDRLATLLAVGTAVCGCTAVVALSPVIRARSSETAVAVGCVIVFGCVGMLLYPMVAHVFFAGSPALAGVFLGTAIHDTSQVIGAAMIYAQQESAPEALSSAGLTKLLRNLSIAVIIPIAAWRFREVAKSSELSTPPAIGDDPGVRRILHRVCSSSHRRGSLAHGFLAVSCAVAADCLSRPGSLRVVSDLRDDGRGAERCVRRVATHWVSADRGRRVCCGGRWARESAVDTIRCHLACMKLTPNSVHSRPLP